MASTTSEGGSSLMGDGSTWTSIHVTPSSNNGPRDTTHLDFVPRYDPSLVRVGRKIGEGGQGRIYEAKLYLPYSFKPVPVVVKKFKPFEGVSQGHFPLEMYSAKFYHMCIPYGVFFEGASMCMILKRYSCDLRSAIDSRMRVLRDGVDGADATPFDEAGGQHIIQQLAMGLKALHELGVYHGDLKAANILLKTSNKNYDPSLFVPVSLVIADFERSDGVVGTGFFRAPEVLQSLRTRVPLSAEEWLIADIYSFGMVCYEVLTGRIPFEGHPLSDYDLVLNGGRPELPEHMPERWRDLMLRCWHADPHSRPTWDDIIEVVLELEETHPRITLDDIIELVAQGNDNAVNSISSVVTLEDFPFEFFLREAKLLIRDLTTGHEGDSQNFGADFMAYHWASEAVATAEAYASQFGVGAVSETPQRCGLQESMGRWNLFASLNHQVIGSTLMLSLYKDLQYEEMFSDAMETVNRRERLHVMLCAIFRKVVAEMERLQPTLEFEVGMPWTSKLVLYHVLSKYVLWCEHADGNSNRAFMMRRVFGTCRSLDAVFEAFLLFLCLMVNAYFYVFAMMSWEPLLLGLQYRLHQTKMKRFNSILYRSYGERICRFQRGWVNCTRYEVVPIVLSAALVAFLGVYGWKGIFGWILVPCVIICSPYWQAVFSSKWVVDLHGYI